ncbi:hypothetical protein SFRURICE_007057 [Spodoptera frugiperda]|nr:hypothetical protein SFRURICE_007057 [Spodoptera frugiperda]
MKILYYTVHTNLRAKYVATRAYFSSAQWHGILCLLAAVIVGMPQYLWHSQPGCGWGARGIHNQEGLPCRRSAASCRSMVRSAAASAAVAPGPRSRHSHSSRIASVGELFVANHVVYRSTPSLDASARQSFPRAFGGSNIAHNCLFTRALNLNGPSPAHSLTPASLTVTFLLTLPSLPSSLRHIRASKRFSVMLKLRCDSARGERPRGERLRTSSRDIRNVCLYDGLVL